ncbi:MAG: hypothetical protein EPO51_08320 [Phenylobacterium sp.]|uniref:hypothetical protein n=1 Tax=Phenylobacterium sp. TaxID=1871053 RepID=UPI0011FAFED5|nr:hypothetical protein [Phenylobacterium sp.]TAJ72114.1 MAG: hypothetical protein EPO51_08320 [Phenylobacterium sp.]
MSYEDVPGSVRQAARALKIKIITKGTVVLNSTHFMDPLGVKLCISHPDILAGEGILPAFRVGDAALKVPPALTIPHYEAVGVGENLLADHMGWLDGQIGRVMPWELADVGDRLRQRLIAGISSDGSAIAKYLDGVSNQIQWRQEIVSALSDMDMSRDRHLHDYIAGLPSGVREKVESYVQASYHAVGTTVVNCEAGTDLSPMSRFKAESVVLANRDVQLGELSDEGIFLKVFMGYALNQIQSCLVPAQIVDQITFTEAHRLSATLRHQGFQEKYERIVEGAIRAASGTASVEEIDFEEIAAISANIAEAFQLYLDEELSTYRTAEFDLTKSEALQTAADLGLDALAAIPGAGTIVSAGKTAVNSAKVAGLSARAFDFRDNERAFAAAKDRKKEDIATVIGKLHISDGKRSQLLDAVAALADIYAIRARRA